jgi:uncharacterized protein (TIGR03435 family)
MMGTNGWAVVSKNGSSLLNLQANDLPIRSWRVLELMRSVKTLRGAMPGLAGLFAVAVAAAWVVALPVVAGAQLLHAADGTAPSFEVATVRPSRSDSGFVNYQISTARFHAENATVAELMKFAYNVKTDDQLPKDPAWIKSEKFDIDAKADDSEVAAMGKLLPEEKFERFRLMMQSLLADRFKLKVSMQTKDLPVYALVVAKGGPHLTEAKVVPEETMRHMPTLAGGSRGELKAGSVSMAMFTWWLSGRTDTGNRVVIDATGLKGSYDFTLNWTPDSMHTADANGGGQGQANTPSTESSEPGFITALEEQLGLKLESRKAPVEVLAIDHVERPSAN